MHVDRGLDLAAAFAAALAERLGENLLRVSLFGSRARGDHRPTSDFDLMIVLRQADRPARSAVHGLAVELELARPVSLSTKILDRERFAALRDTSVPFWRRFREDEVVVWPQAVSKSA